MLKTLGTNALWSKYSLKGKKGKIAVQPLPVCGVMISKLNLKSINMRKKTPLYVLHSRRIIEHHVNRQMSLLNDFYIIFDCHRYIRIAAVYFIKSIYMYNK